MPAPLRGTQSLVGQMGWVFERPLLTALEVLWRWSFGLPLVVVALLESAKIFTALPPESAGLASIDPQNPWVAASQIASAWSLYLPHVNEVLLWLAPVSALAWVVASGLGRSLILKRMISSDRENAAESGEFVQNNTAGAKARHFIGAFFGTTEVVPCYKANCDKANSIPGNSTFFSRPLAMIALQAVWLSGFTFACWCWLRSMQWVGATHITPNAEPDLIGYSIWLIFLSLTFFTLWALASWALSIAPLLQLLEERSVLSALGHALRLGGPMTAKLIEINLVMGIVNLALIVVAMVLSAAPLPFGDQLGPDALHVVWGAATVFYFVASDYFQVVRLKSFHEMWKIFRGPQAIHSKAL